MPDETLAHHHDDSSSLFRHRFTGIWCLDAIDQRRIVGGRLRAIHARRHRPTSQHLLGRRSQQLGACAPIQLRLEVLLAEKDRHAVVHFGQIHILNNSATAIEIVSAPKGSTAGRSSTRDAVGVAALRRLPDESSGASEI